MKAEIISTIALANSKEGLISLAKISEPYGQNSPSVLSIGVGLKADAIDYKVHIPLANLNELITKLSIINDQLKNEK